MCYAPFDLRALLADIQAIMSLRAEQKNVSLTISIDEDQIVVDLQFSRDGAAGRGIVLRGDADRHLQPCPQLPEERKPLLVGKTKAEGNGIDRLARQSQRSTHFGRRGRHRYRDALLLQIRRQKRLHDDFVFYEKD
jgi:hypothetical protein